MNQEREQLLDQNYALSDLDNANGMLKECQEYVGKAALERDPFALSLKNRIELFLKRFAA